MICCEVGVKVTDHCKNAKKNCFKNYVSIWCLLLILGLTYTIIYMQVGICWGRCVQSIFKHCGWFYSSRSDFAGKVGFSQFNLISWWKVPKSKKEIKSILIAPHHFILEATALSSQHMVDDEVETSSAAELISCNFKAEHLKEFSGTNWTKCWSLGEHNMHAPHSSTSKGGS